MKNGFNGNRNTGVNNNTGVVIYENNNSPIYNTTVVNNIINIIPKTKPEDDYRDALSAIRNQTRTRYHIFSGFVNLITEDKIVLCNIFWNKNIYVCNHVNIFDVPNDIVIGDFITFKGEIYDYTREKDKTEDIGIKICEIINKISPDKNIEIHEEDNNGCDILYLNNMSPENLEQFYFIQITKINSKLIYYPYLRSDIYEAILQTVYYECTKEYEMVKNKLNIDINEMTPDLCKWLSFMRYLIVDLDIISPFLVYTIMCTIIKRKSKNVLNRGYNKTVRKFSVDNFNMLSLDRQKLMAEYLHRLGFFIEEFKIIMGDKIKDENE